MAASMAGDDSHLYVVPAESLSMLLPRSIFRAKERYHQSALSAGWGCSCKGAFEPSYPQATRDQFKNHPTHNCDIGPTIGGYWVVR